MDGKGLEKYEGRDGQEVTLSFDIIKRFLVQGHPDLVTDQEMVYFIGICKSRGLNPFIRDCYLIKYSKGDNAAIITSVDYFRKRARAQKDCKGWQSGIILERNGEIIYSKGIMLKDDTLLGGWFRAQPEGWTVPCEKEVNLNGYIKKTKEGNITKFWAKEKQPSMIEKVALSQGLRECWPDEFQQLYTPEEMGDPEMFIQAEKEGKKTLETPGGAKKDPYGVTDPTPNASKKWAGVDDRAKDFAEAENQKGGDSHDDLALSGSGPDQVTTPPPNGDEDLQIISQFHNLQKTGLWKWEKDNRKALPLMSAGVQKAWDKKFHDVIKMKYSEWLATKDPNSSPGEQNTAQDQSEEGEGAEIDYSDEDTFNAYMKECQKELGPPLQNRIYSGFDIRLREDVRSDQRIMVASAMTKEMDKRKK